MDVHPGEVGWLDGDKGRSVESTGAAMSQEKESIANVVYTPHSD